MDANPLSNADPSDGESSSSTSSVNGASYTETVIQPPSSTVLQTVNIRTHVPVKLDITESNYTKSRCFLDAFIGKFGLSSHLTVAPTSANRHDPNWVMVDQCILSWLYNSVSKDVWAIVRGPKAMA
jgi:hypothetical protein